jgi:hypothetical protein
MSKKEPIMNKEEYLTKSHEVVNKLFGITQEFNELADMDIEGSLINKMFFNMLSTICLSFDNVKEFGNVYTKIMRKE